MTSLPLFHLVYKLYFYIVILTIFNRYYKYHYIYFFLFDTQVKLE